ncbi:MAG: hypothetical protein LBQ12_14255 [Deltaproteobacteria bacterium]|nr:hypothetical protein [Deltaproteobacteria bacterium]
MAGEDPMDYVPPPLGRGTAIPPPKPEDLIAPSLDEEPAPAQAPAPPQAPPPADPGYPAQAPPGYPPQAPPGYPAQAPPPVATPPQSPSMALMSDEPYAQAPPALGPGPASPSAMMAGAQPPMQDPRQDLQAFGFGAIFDYFPDASSPMQAMEMVLTSQRFRAMDPAAQSAVRQAMYRAYRPTS